MLSSTLPAETLDVCLSLLTSSFRSYVRVLPIWGGGVELTGGNCCEHLTCRVAVYRLRVLTDCPFSLLLPPPPSPSGCSGAVLLGCLLVTSLGFPGDGWASPSLLLHFFLRIFAFDVECPRRTVSAILRTSAPFKRFFFSSLHCVSALASRMWPLCGGVSSLHKFRRVVRLSVTNPGAI